MCYFRGLVSSWGVPLKTVLENRQHSIWIAAKLASSIGRMKAGRPDNDKLDASGPRRVAIWFEHRLWNAGAVSAVLQVHRVHLDVRWVRQNLRNSRNSASMASIINHQWQCPLHKIQGLATGTSWRWKAWCRSTSNIAFPKEDVWSPALILHGVLAALCRILDLWIFVISAGCIIITSSHSDPLLIPSHFHLFHVFHLTDTRRWICKHYPECPASRRRWW